MKIFTDKGTIENLINLCWIVFVREKKLATKARSREGSKRKIQLKKLSVFEFK